MQKITLFIILSTLLFCNNQNSTSDAKAIRGTYCDDIPDYKICTNSDGGAAACAKKFSCTDRASALISALAATSSTGTANCSQINNTVGNADIGFYDPVSKGCQYSTLTQCGETGTTFYNSISQKCVSFFVTQDAQTCSPIANRVSLYDSLTRSCSYISTSDAARFGISSNMGVSPNTAAPTNNTVNPQACWITNGKISDTTGASVNIQNAGSIDYTCPPLTFNPQTNTIPDAYKYKSENKSIVLPSTCAFDTNTNVVYLSKDLSQNIVSPLRSISQYKQACDVYFIKIIGEPQSTSTNTPTPTMTSNFVLEDDYLSYCRTNGADKNYAKGICQGALSTLGDPSLETTSDFKSCLDQCSKAK